MPFRSSGSEVLRAGGLDSRRFRPGSGVSSATAGDRLLLAHLDRGTAYRLNDTASTMWELFSGGCTIGEVADALHQRLGASRGQIEADASRLVEELLAEGLLEPRSDVP